MKNFSTEQGCVADGCKVRGGGMTCLHHLYTQKSRPDLQLRPWNMIPVCQAHHNMFHNQGTGFMASRFSGVYAWLTSNGWEFDEFFKKWRHPGAQLSGND